ncbi:DUF3383 family protein [Heyndrickxia sporothermodurans]|uniref:DUF3383 family protein n=1 Tax=Heyndrickxia sporothermodurans TaxID=46224 RepID=A0AB37HM11_9BACI|nr:DUF3383 family protein [Heyndrickxia sporothermodurans]MBL5768413.1 DUF3383 family protein [Heyndrickxia sporothermodurans]MBL5771022.1 DUF3383 family protein [Heyndrickxia sporothermodurans]MBL5774682.1 DUF3383 family protein [Heyndrickxia sporothermodurans]MBL5778124.1 DUF3383 family protein [Heyndrickxia sporothermodurans]MBL5785397.1 DUF3383 family protein [Heyndrickxia sporothermodurans]
MPLTDVTVKIDLLKPSGLVGLGKVLILAKKTGESTIKNYSEITKVLTDFPKETNAYKKAAAVLGQENRPKEIAIATYDPDGMEVTTAEDAITKYYDKDWFFVVTADAELADQLKVADFVEGKAFKMYAVQTTDPESRNAFKAKAYDYVVNFYHPNDGEEADAALVGELGSQEVGSITWKFKRLAGLTPIDIDSSELKAIHEDGAIAYVTKAGLPQTSEGIVVSGEYIDVMHSKSWIKVNIETSIQTAFANNPKIPFDSDGISLMNGQVTTVLEQGFSQGMIAKNEEGEAIYNVNTLSRSEVSPADRASRIYNGLSFSFELAGAIHEANITGEILV